MKKLNLVFVFAIVMSIIISSATAQHKLSNFEKYELYLDSLDQTIYGNYYLIQPKLYEILNMMPEEAGRQQIIKDLIPPATAYPLIFSVKLNQDDLGMIDTLRFNPLNDTILCKNSVRIEDSYTNCELISTLDSMRIFDIYSKTPLFTHGFTVDSCYKELYIDLIKNWDSNKIDIVCPTFEQMPYSPYSMCISRIIIKCGKLVDVKYKNCVSIEFQRLESKSQAHNKCIK